MAHKSKYDDGASDRQKESFKQFLSEDEELVLVSGYGFTYLRNRWAFYFIIPGSLCFLIGIALSYYYGFNIGYGLIIGMVMASFVAYIKALWDFHAHRYLLTTRRVIVKTGFFNINLASALYDKITHIEVEQSFIDRILYHHGDVIVHTSGTNKDEMILHYLDDPIEFKNILERLINRERQQMGRTHNQTMAMEGELVE